MHLLTVLHCVLIPLQSEDPYPQSTQNIEGILQGLTKIFYVNLYPDRLTYKSMFSYLYELHRTITFSTKKAHICVWIIQRNENPERGKYFDRIKI